MTDRRRHMDHRQTEARRRAVQLLQHYIRTIMTRCALEPDGDTDAELEQLVDELIEAATPGLTAHEVNLAIAAAHAVPLPLHETLPPASATAVQIAETAKAAETKVRNVWDGAQSARSCGCDPGINYSCERHKRVVSDEPDPRD